MESPDRNVEKNREMLLERSIVGLRKYGVTTDNNPLSLKQWLRHLLEETLDAANYIQAAITEIERQEGQTMRTRIDEKHHIANNQIIKTSNGQPIPDDEPRILFRGRDKLALPMLRHYRELCVADGCTDYQLESMDRMIAEFQVFAESSATMKQPGITKGA